MRKEEMVCVKCIKYEDPCAMCHASPIPQQVSDYDPDRHWCAQGEWHVWSERYKEFLRYKWGEWEGAGDEE